jgi:hypothetical protein
VRRAVLVVPALLAALAPGAVAAPTVAPEQGSEVVLQLRTRHETVVLALLATAPVGGGAPRLRIRLDTPAAQIRWYGELPASALTTAGGVTTLRARLGSTPLTVRWTPEPYSASVDYGSHAVGPDAARGWTVTGTSGTVAVALGAVRCRVSVATMGTALVYDTGGTVQGLAQGLGLDLRGAWCGDLPSGLPPVP